MIYKIQNELLIELSNIKVEFNRRVILFDINLRIYRGEYIGLIGKNGSGKSTLLKTILGLIPLSKGIIKLYGKDKNTEIYEKIGYVPQLHAIQREFPATVGKVVEMGLYGKKNLESNSKENNDKIMHALHKVKMEDFIDRPIGHLSGGEQQKVLVAQALVREPEILLLDEPTSAFDYIVLDDFLNLLTELNKKYNMTLIVIQHQFESLRQACSRLLMLRKTILYDGLPNNPEVDQLLPLIFNYKINTQKVV